MVFINPLYVYAKQGKYYNEFIINEGRNDRIKIVNGILVIIL